MAKAHETELDKAQLLPTKDTLTALKSDVNLMSACLELCDNALDAWKRSSNRESPATINIDVSDHGDRTELRIRDNAGGIPRENAAMLFGLGQTAKANGGDLIGTYGVGAKKSLVNLGIPFRISSRASDESVGWTYRITEDWFDNDQDWTVDVHKEPDISPGVTEIEIEDLNYEWTEETETELRTRLGRAYNIFLSEDWQALHGVDYDLSILVNGSVVEPEGLPDWSYSPFDGLRPRRYENIPIEIPNEESEITLHITVGLLTKKDGQQAGTDIYCQKRKVASSLWGPSGGFGSDQNFLGNFNSRHQRLKIIIELETKGNGQLLPWDTQKSSIDAHSPVMRGTGDTRGVYNWLRRAAQDYYDADADQVPQAFLEPFGSNNELAVEDGTPTQFDYSDRKRVVTNHRPDSELTEISTIIRKAEAHAVLQITCEENLQDWQVPAYRSQLSRESDRKLENLAAIAEEPPEEVVNEPHNVAGLINELARIHFENGICYTQELEDWAIPRYKNYLNRQDERAYTEVHDPPEGVPLSLSDVRPDSSEDKEEVDDLNSMPTPRAHSGKQIEVEQAQKESAEIFLVLEDESGDQRGATLLDVDRATLCQQLNLETSVSDEVLWEEVRHAVESQFGN